MKAGKKNQGTSSPHLAVVKGSAPLPKSKPQGKQSGDAGRAGKTAPEMLMPEQPGGYIRCKKHDCL